MSWTNYKIASELKGNQALVLYKDRKGRITTIEVGLSEITDGTLRGLNSGESIQRVYREIDLNSLNRKIRMIVGMADGFICYRNFSPSFLDEMILQRK